MSRFSIKNAAGLFYSGNQVTETVHVPTPGNPTLAVARSFIAPQFEAVVEGGALKYGTEEDATAMLTHPDLQDAQAFAGCVVIRVEVDTAA